MFSNKCTLTMLLICNSKFWKFSSVLFQRALDPPDPEIVQDALDLLVRMQALERTSRGRYEPTFYGRLLASFPLSFDASVLILKFGNIGMMHEGILIGVLMDTQPLPILRPFGDDQLVLLIKQIICRFYKRLVAYTFYFFIFYFSDLLQFIILVVRIYGPLF